MCHVCTVHSLVRCVENLSAYQIRSRLSGAVLRVVRDEPHDRIARSCLATLPVAPPYGRRPPLHVAHTYLLSSHCPVYVPSSVWLLPCIAIRTATKFESIPVSSVDVFASVHVFLGITVFLRDSSTHSATALGLADPDYTIPTLINSEHRRTSPSLLDRMQYVNPGSVSGPPGVLISWLRPHPYIVCTSIEYTPTET